MDTPFIKILFVPVELHPMITEEKDSGIIVHPLLLEVLDNLTDFLVCPQQTVVMPGNQTSGPIQYQR